VARFCALMKGEVKVESPPEGGARFIVRLPAETRTPVEPEGAAAS